MKITFRTFFLFSLFFVFAITANARQVSLESASGEKYVNMPTSGTDTLVLDTTTEFYVYDDGGASGNYSNGVSSDLVVFAPPGLGFAVSGTLLTESCCDDLKILDGSRTLIEAKGDRSDIDVAISSSVIKFSFHSDVSVVKTGFALKVNVVDGAVTYNVTVNQVESGMVHSSTLAAEVGKTVELYAHAWDGLLNYIDVVTSNGRKVEVDGGNWYTSDTASFTMPSSDVTVTPVFVRNPTAEDGLFLKMPQEGRIMAYIPEKIESFKFYDNGGEEGGYTAGGAASASLHVPWGYEMKLTGSISLSDGKCLIVFPSISDTITLCGQISNIDSVYSEGGWMEFAFYDYSEDTSSGWDLKVSIVRTEPYSISLSNTNGGTVTTSVKSAIPGQQVEVNAIADEGYVLDKIYVDDGSWSGVSVKGGKWYSNRATFTMPESNVSVSAHFVEKWVVEDRLFIDMPRSETIVANISSEVKSFNIYDNGGSDSNYVCGEWGLITLYAPPGYAFRITGSVDISEDAYFRIEADSQMVEISGNQPEIDTLEGESMSVYMSPEQSGWYTSDFAGFALKVTLFKKAEYAAVSVTEDKEGRVSATIDGSYDGWEDLYIPEEIDVDTIVLNREFPVGGSSTGYATIVLPFDINGASVDGWRQVVEFAGIDLNENNKKYVKMYRVWCRDDVDEECATLDGNLKAYTPYMVQMDDGSLEFHGPVKLLPTETPVARIDNWEFRGTLSKKVWEEGDADLGKVYGFASKGNEGVDVGQFAKALPGARIGALRAYMIRDVVAPRPPYKMAAPAPENASVPEVMEIVIVNRPKVNKEEEHTDVQSEEKIEEERSVNPPTEKKDDQHTMVIGRINTRTGEITLEQNYDIRGRKLNGKPMARGVFYSEKKLVK